MRISKCDVRIQNFLCASTTVFATCIALVANPCQAEPFKKFRLDNGLNIIIVPIHGLRIIHTEVVYDVGSNSDPCTASGTAHAVEHMMFSGTRFLSSEQLAWYSYALGGNYNAWVNKDSTHFSYEVPSSALELVSVIEADRMRHITFDSLFWRREQHVLEQEISEYYSDPFTRHTVARDAFIFDKTAYSRAAIGKVEDIKPLNTLSLKEFYDHYYKPSNATLIIVGDVNISAAEKIVAQAFGKVNPEPKAIQPPSCTHPEGTKFSQPQSVEAKGNVTLSYLLPGTGSLRYLPYLLLSLMLNRMIDEQSNFSGIDPRLESISFDISPGSSASVAELRLKLRPSASGEINFVKARRILRRIFALSLSEVYLREVKRSEYRSYLEDQMSVSALAKLWSDVVSERLYSSPEARRLAFDRISLSQIKVVADTFNKLPSLGMYMDDKETIAGNARPRDALQSSDSSDSRVSPSPNSLAASPRTLTSGDKLFDFEHMLHGPITPPATSSILANGIRVTSVHIHDLGMSAIFGRFARVERAKAERDDEQLRAAANYCFERHFFRPAPIGQTKNPRLIQTNLQVNGTFSIIGYRKTVYELLDGIANYSSNRCTSKDLKYLSNVGVSIDKYLKKVNKYIDENFGPNYTEFVIVGSDGNDYAGLVSKRLARWPRAPASFKDRSRGWETSNSFGTLDLTPSQAKENCNVRHSWPLIMNVQDQRRVALDIGMRVVGGGMTSRLQQALRVNKGILYYISGSTIWEKDKGYAFIEYTARKDHVSLIEESVKKILENMHDDLISPDEVDAAKISLINSFRVRLDSIQSIGEFFISLYAYDFSLGDITRWRDAIVRVDNVSASDALQNYIAYDKSQIDTNCHWEQKKPVY